MAADGGARDASVFPDGGPVQTPAQVMSECGTGLRLPDVRVSGYVVGMSIPPQPHIGGWLGVMNERAPVPFDLENMAAVFGMGELMHMGWLFQAQAGEQFELQELACEFARWDAAVFGPIHACAADATATPVWQPSGANLAMWNAPADGVYFLTPQFGSWRNNDGGYVVEDVTPGNACNDEWAFGWRRLLPDGSPAGHTLVETHAWSFPGLSRGLYQVSDARFARIDGRMAVVALGSLGAYPDAGGAALFDPGLLVARGDALDAPQRVLACHPLSGGRVLIGNFAGGPQDDVLWGGSVFVGGADGGFTCAPSGLPSLSGANPWGALDLDGDGSLDLVGVNVQPTGDTSRQDTLIYARPYYHRAGGWYAGAYRSATVPIAAYYPSTNSRGELLDVDHNGTLDIVVAIRGPTTTESLAQRTYAFHVPAPVPQDDLQDAGVTTVPLVPINLATSQLPSPTLLGRQGPRSPDLDRDGTLDWVSANRIGFSEEGLAYTYGEAAGIIGLPWLLLASDQRGHDAPTLDDGDISGDGCPDLLLGGAGLTLFEGRRCQ